MSDANGKTDFGENELIWVSPALHARVVEFWYHVIMRTIFLSLILLFLCSVAAPVAGAEPAGDECLVIGAGSDPVKGATRFSEAVQAWRRGFVTQALQAYEQAIIADRAILARDDEGMALGLLERYRKLSETSSPTVALLCRKGFFENIIIGDLEDSIRHYRQAAELASNQKEKATATAEAERLERELVFIRQWQTERQAKLVRERGRDLVDYTRKESQRQISDRREELDSELQELNERLAYLTQEEGKARDEMYENMRKAVRYRRWTYYEGPQGAAPEEVRDPAQDMELMYSSRRRMNSSQEQANHIRSEITGVKRRIEAIQKEQKKLDKQ